MSVLTVGPGQPYATIIAAVAAAQPGDTIDVQAGIYTNDFVGIYKNLTLQAVGGPVQLVATTDPPNGKAIIDEGGAGITVTINGFDISGAAVPDGNGAAIRYEGGSLTLNNDNFHNNEDGLLAASDPNGTITINNSEFAFNGFGDVGHTHNLYVNQIALLNITDSYFHDANVGHEIKSRAENTTITGSRIFDNNSTASYSVDLPNGGNATIRNNVIEQGPSSENQTIIAYGEEGSLHAGTNVLIADNTIVNDRNGAIGVWNRTAQAVTLQNNSVYGLTSANLVSGPANVSGTTFLASRPVLDLGSHWMPTVAQPTGGSELVNNGSFENNAANPVPAGLYASNRNIAGWTTDAGSAALEVVDKSYRHIGDGTIASGAVASDGHWLDSQGSPGGIDISQVISGLHAGDNVQIAFKVAAENIPGVQATNPNEKLDVSFGGNLVKEVTLADFATGGGVDYNSFHTFTANVVVGADDTLRIASQGASQGAGFAMNSVSIKAMVLPTT